MAAVISIKVETSGGLEDVKRDIQDLGKTAEASGGGFSAMQEIATGALRAIGEGVVGLAVKGFGALKDAMADGIADAQENAKIQAQTAQVLKSTGNAAGKTTEQIAAYASSLSDAAGTSLFGDDQIQQSTNLLLTFTNIKGASLDAATAISVDMAQAMGGAPKDAAIQLGKALNDPIKGITALSRVGVTFTDEQKAQIQAMQEAGDTAGAQAVILGELNKEFGGSAQAAADATGGWSEFNGRMGEAKEALGAAVLPLLSSLAGILLDTVVPAVEGIAAAFGPLIQYFQSVVEDGDTMNDFLASLPVSIQPFVQAIGDAIVVIQGFGATIMGAFAGAQDATDGLGSQIAFMLDTLLGVTADVGPVEAAFDAVNAVLQSLIATFTSATTPIQGFIAVLDQVSPVFQLVHGVISAVLPSIQMIITSVFGIISGFIQEHGAKIRSDITEAWQQIHALIAAITPPIQAIISQVFGAVASFLHNHGDEIKAFLGQTWDAIANIVKTALQLIQAILVPVLTFIAGFIRDHGEQIQALLTNTWNSIKAVIDAALTLIQGVITAALQIIQGNWSGAWETIKQMCARIVLDLWTIIQGGLNNIVTLFGGLATQVMSVLEKLPEQAKELGDNVISGIISGVEGAAGALYDKMKDIASSALHAAKHALGIESPSTVFADEVGAPLIAGIMSGIEGMVPALTSVMNGVASGILEHTKKITQQAVDEANKMEEDLLDQVQGLGDKISNVMADAFSGTATLDRAKAKALAMLKDVSAAQSGMVQQQLQAASKTAAGFGDPKQAAAFFKMRSDQIFELAKLQGQIDTEKDATTKARLIEQYNLIGQAQQSELDAFGAGAKDSKTPAQQVLAQIQSLLSKPGIPGAIDDPTHSLSALFGVLPQLTALATGGPQVSSSMYNNKQFTYAPTISTTGNVSAPMDLALASSLAGV